MKYSKSRPKIIASGVLDALGTVLYAGVAVACFVIGVVLMNTDPSESDGTLTGQSVRAQVQSQPDLPA